ncbi:MAG: sulfite exporter TauE/SafE family protein [Candidatus Bathyarchaeia archaeon]
MLPADIVLLIVLGFLVGIIAAMTGIGGGSFIVPALTLLYGFSSQEAIGTSLAVIVFTSIASTYAYSRQKRIDYKTGAVSTVTTTPGAVLGAYMTSFISSNTLGIIFSLFLFFIALRMLLSNHISFSKAIKNQKTSNRRLVDFSGRIFEYKVNMFAAFILAFFGGLSSGLLGIGGGALIVPILTIAVGLPMHIAVATSMFIMIFTSIAGVITHIQLNNVKFEHSIYMAIGIIIGTQIGAIIAKKVSGKTLSRVFGLTLIIVSVRLLLKFV